MTVPDTPEIMKHIVEMDLDAKMERSIAAGECEKAITEKDDAWWAVAEGRYEKWTGYIDALCELKEWILTSKKDEPYRFGEADLGEDYLEEGGE